MKIVTVYQVTREYGGPEEGGWWYDHREWIRAYQFKDEYKAKRNLERLKKFFADEPNIKVILENELGEHETKTIPRYC